MPAPGTARRTFRRLGALAIAIAFALIAVPASRAQGQLSVAWQDCAPDGVANLSPTCEFDSIERLLFLSFRPDVRIDDVVGWSLVVDLVSDASPLPAWWQLQPGGCRSGQLVAGPAESVGANCEDLWSATGAALVQSVTYPRPGGDARQLRVIVGVGVPAGDAFTLLAGSSYLAAVLKLRFARTVPPGECVGCTAPACIVFNSAEIFRLPGAPGDPVPPLDSPAPGDGNRVTWGSGSSCAAVPAIRGTWGRLKSLYR